jgi:hypothetical protein
MLYVAEMAQNNRFLVSVYSIGELKFSTTPFLICTFREVGVVARNVENLDLQKNED